MKKIFLAVFLLLPNIPADAAEDGHIKCNPEGNNSEMIACAYDDFHKSDAKLNKIYAKLISTAKQDDKDSGGGDGFGGYEQSLRESQRAWVKFRDADCLRQTTDFMGGSQRRLDYPNCLAYMTENRIKELSEVKDTK